ncbi:PREDICTED: uncharacterized protein LOC105461884 isoform X2 [Wasmannia auropunctata]|nr:PREDICTED: uncharacterized protein LOC105461884 isoform X2 [Wasmannia auropunctata]
MGFVTASKPLSILLMQTLPSISHHIWTENLVKGLLREGHHVHVVSTIEIKIEGKLVQNLTNAIFENAMTFEDANYGPDQWEKLMEFYMAHVTYQFAISYCDILIKTNAAKQLLEMIKTIKFDVIVADISLHQCFYGLWEVAKDQPPVVAVLPLGNIPLIKNFIGVSSYSTVRPYTSATFAKPVGLWLRTWNTLYYIVDDLIRYYYFLPTVQRLAEEYVGHTIRPLYEIEKDKVNIILVLLVNSHPAFESAIPLPPNVLEVGGLHAQIVQPIAGDVIVTYSEVREIVFFLFDK